jgi:hypothetical protein
MSDEFKATWWSIKVAPNWHAESEAECTTIWQEAGVGALQISVYKCDRSPVPENDLSDFMNGEFPGNTPIESVTHGQFAGVGVEYVLDEKFWRKRWLTNGQLLVYVTYNCGFADRSIETSAVDQMLETLKPL